jgi:hypothetical protein
MHPLVRVVGKMLRLVGISSPEDSISRSAASSEPPSGLAFLADPESTFNQTRGVFQPTPALFNHFLNHHPWPADGEADAGLSVQRNSGPTTTKLLSPRAYAHANSSAKKVLPTVFQ